MKSHRTGSSIPVLALFALSVLVLSAPGPAFAFASAENASTVLGQSTFTTSSSALTAAGLSLPTSVAFDPAGNAWVVDYSNNRVLEYKAPFTSGEAASVVLGQTGFTTNTFATTASGMNQPIGVAFDPSGNLWVVEHGNTRVIEFQPPFTTGESASVVIGEPSFTTAVIGLSQNTLFEPWAIAFDKSGNLWVSDHGNNRILEFAAPFSDDEFASVVIGQTDFTSNVAANTQNGLGDPFGIAFDSSNNLYVADGWARVMVFDPPFVTGELASVVIGQASFTTHVTATTQGGMSSPYDLAFGPSGNLWVSDNENDRVTMYPAPFTTGELAQKVIGQASYTTNAFATTQGGLFGPWGIATGPGGALWVADSDNNRVLSFPARLSTTTSVVCSPTSVAVGSPSTCTATVTDTGGGVAQTPAGTVTFASSLAGTFSSADCTLSGSGGTSSCSVTFTPSASGTATITGTFGATSFFSPSRGRFTLTAT